jgi:hypothetical protein
MPIETAPRKNPESIELGIATEKVCHIIVKARAWNAKEADADPDSGSNATDDRMADVLENTADDATRQELAAFINSLDEEEQIALVALAWVGRGTFDAGDWQQALDTARAERNGRTADYLLGLPLLGDYLDEGLAAFGRSCADFNARI